jgi:lysophospholipase L1-like esterase
VLTLGGSTTRNHRLDREERYPRQLERLLRSARPGVQIEVVNAGQNWWTTKHSLVNYVTYASAWQPDVVVVMHAINDLEKSMLSADYTLGAYDPQWTHHYASAANAALAPTFEQWLARRVRGLTDKWGSALRFRPVDYPLEKYVSLPSFRANLARVTHYAQADGAEVVLVTQPSVYRDDLDLEEQQLLHAPIYMQEPDGWLRRRSPTVESLRRAMAAFNEATVEVSKATNARLVLGAEAVPKTFEYFIDEVHYTPRGARALAEAVAAGVLATTAFARTASAAPAPAASN